MTMTIDCEYCNEEIDIESTETQIRCPECLEWTRIPEYA